MIIGQVGKDFEEDNKKAVDNEIDAENQAKEIAGDAAEEARGKVEGVHGEVTDVIKGGGEGADVNMKDELEGAADVFNKEADEATQFAREHKDKVKDMIAENVEDLTGSLKNPKKKTKEDERC